MSDSISEIAERLAADGIIIEECDASVGIQKKESKRERFILFNGSGKSGSKSISSDYIRCFKPFPQRWHSTNSFISSIR